MSINITGGTEKQNAWATSIADKQLTLVDIEIERTEARQDESLAWYLEDLRRRRAVMVDGLQVVGAKKIIDLHVAGRANLADALIALARDSKNESRQSRRRIQPTAP